MAQDVRAARDLVTEALTDLAPKVSVGIGFSYGQLHVAVRCPDEEARDVVLPLVEALDLTAPYRLVITGPVTPILGPPDFGTDDPAS